MSEQQTFNESTGKYEVENADEVFAPETVVEPEAGGEVIPEENAHRSHEEAPEVKTEEPAPAEPVVPERLLAGRFKTSDELRNGFANLGGDPSKYETDAQIEEAYQIRQSEFTRVRQEQAERERINNLNTEHPTPNQEGNQPDIAALLDKVDWDNVQDARDLMMKTVEIVQQMTPKGQEVQSPQEIAQAVEAEMQRKYEANAQLTNLEQEIPRLRIVDGQPNEFREAFASHVVAEKGSGRFTDLKSSMENFLRWGREAALEAKRVESENLQNRTDAGAASGQADGLPTGGSGDDELDGILDAFKSRRDKLDGVI